MAALSANSDWNSFGRVNASVRWRGQSAAMGGEMTRVIVETAGVSPGDRVLDIACGAGEPAISIAEKLAGTGELVGIDLSPASVEIARERAAQRKLTNVVFQQCDAHALPFATDSFDLITSRLGVMFFSDLPRALGEMRRVLKPGGRATLVAWGPLEQQPYFETTIGTVLRLFPDIALPESGRMIFTFGRKGVLARALRDAGFSQAEEQFSIVPWTWPGSPEEVWEYFQQVAVPFAGLFQSIPEAGRPQVDREVLGAIRKYYDGSEIKFTAAI